MKYIIELHTADDMTESPVIESRKEALKIARGARKREFTGIGFGSMLNKATGIIVRNIKRDTVIYSESCKPLKN